MCPRVSSPDCMTSLRSFLRHLQPLQCPPTYTVGSCHMRRSSSKERPAHHANDDETSFQNPWMKPKSLLASGQVLAQQFPIAFERELQAHHITPVRVVEPDFGGPLARSNSLKATWLGHAVRIYLYVHTAPTQTHSSGRASW